MTCHPYFQELSLLKEAPTLMCAQLPVPETDVTTVPTWDFLQEGASMCTSTFAFVCADTCKCILCVYVHVHVCASCTCLGGA